MISLQHFGEGTLEDTILWFSMELYGCENGDV